MPILIGDITLYVQFHIVQNPAYDVLLGRPFDILVESIVRNYSNEDQTITIHDLNSRRIATVPTFPCGTHLQTARPSQDLLSAIKEISHWSSKPTLHPPIPTRFFHFLTFRLPHLEQILPFAILRPAASVLVPIPSNSPTLPTGTPCHTHLDHLRLPIPLSLP